MRVRLILSCFGHPDRACNGDADLRKGVDGLLAANDRSGTFMRPPAGGDITADDRPSEGPGNRPW